MEDTFLDALEGVESNEDSRFIDHTKATNWESIESDIQGFCKEDSLKSKTIEYECDGLSLSVSICKVTSLGSLIHRVFGVDEYIELCSPIELYSLTSSCKSYVFSTLISGSTSSSSGKLLQHNYPTFFLSKSLREVYGYQKSVISYGVELVRHFSSYVYDDITVNHPMYYFDGILNVFLKELSEFMGQYETVSKTIFVDLKETYCITDRLKTDLKAELEAHHPVIIYTLEDLWFTKSNQNLNSGIAYSQGSFNLSIDIQWNHVKHSNIIENSSFTTFLPSRLPPQNWSIKLKSIPNHKEINSTPLANCLRKYLSLYIIGKCCRDRIAIYDFILSLDELTPEFDSEKAKYTAAVLSQASQKVLNDFLENKSLSFEWEAENEEYLMRLNAKQIWVKRKESYSDYVMPWDWLKECDVSPVGSWLSLSSLFVGACDSIKDMLETWRVFIQDVRLHYENNVPLARLYAPVPIGGGEVINPIKNPDSNLPVYKRLFWDDVITKKQESGTYFSIPECSYTVTHQKLEMLQMCILSNDIDLTTDIDLDEEKRTKLNNLGLNIPRVLRRLPMTRDNKLQQNFLSYSFNSEGEINAAAKSEHPLLRWQISNPEIISDCKSFKAANPSAQAEDFVKFYQLLSLNDVENFNDSEIIFIDALIEIFNNCESVSATDQKPLFKVSMEAEKALSYLESMSVLAIAAELLMNSMVTIHFMISHANSEILSQPFYKHELDDLRSCVSSAVKSIKNDISNFDENGSDSISQETLVLIDNVCNKVEYIENMIQRYNFLDSNHVPNVVKNKLAQCDQVYTAETEEQAKILFELAKRSSKVFENDWHSKDGRQLGQPNRKEYELYIPSDSISNCNSFTECNKKDLSSVSNKIKVEIYESSMRMSTIFSERYLY